MIKVVADENIGFISAMLAGEADVVTVPGRSITPEQLRHADALLVRAVTRVDERLLGDTSVRFVGTTTSGFDHIDKDWLDDRNIAFAYAPGSNANSVAEYVTAALLKLADRFNESFEGKAIGIIGAGHIGMQMAMKAQAMGLRVFLNDPPLFESTRDKKYLPLIDVLSESDIVTLHVPLTNDGPYRTLKMVDDDFLSKMKQGAWLVNASRGQVVDELALKAILESRDVAAAVLDVWFDEPHPDARLIELATIATPHIAGYSFNGKVSAVRQVVGALSNQFDLSPDWSLLDKAIPDFDTPLPCADGRSFESVAHELISRRVYDIAADDRNFRAAMAAESLDERGRQFDALRKHYHRRFEFPTYRVEGSKKESAGVPDCIKRLQALGFRLN